MTGHDASKNGLPNAADGPSGGSPASGPSDSVAKLDWRTVLIGALSAVCLLPAMKVGGVTLQLTPPVALALGIVLALTKVAPKGAWLSKAARLAMQIGVVLLGLGMNLREVVEAGVSGLLFAAGTIGLAFAGGAILGRLLGIDRKLWFLLSSGTAICGGSAIAAVSTVIKPDRTHVSVAIGVVFMLNAVALYLFPPLGQLLGLSSHQFGTWAAVAIHDVSSVVGASQSFDHLTGHSDTSPALHVATAVKLSRALWIVPLVFFAAWWFGRTDREATGKAKVTIPWFVVLFVVAAAVGTFVPPVREIADDAGLVGKRLMAVALLLVGCGLSVQAVRSVGWRALVLGVSLWVLVSVTVLFVVRAMG